MKIFIDGEHAPAGHHIRTIVRKALGEERTDAVQVFVSRPRPGRWSVFIAGLDEHPLPMVESIQRALDETDQ